MQIFIPQPAYTNIKSHTRFKSDKEFFQFIDQTIDELNELMGIKKASELLKKKHPETYRSIVKNFSKAENMQIKEKICL